MSRRKDSRSGPGRLALQDQADAATSDVNAANRQFFADQGDYGESRREPWAAPMVDAFRAWVVRTQCRDHCPHIWQTPMLMWRPTVPALLCAECAALPALAEMGTDENWTCDLCRRLRPEQDPGFESACVTIPAMADDGSGLVFPPVVIAFGVCAACRTAGELHHDLAEIFAGLLNGGRP